MTTVPGTVRARGRRLTVLLSCTLTALAALAGCAAPMATSCMLGSQPVRQRHSVAWHLADVYTVAQLQRLYGIIGRRMLPQEMDAGPTSCFEPRAIASLTPEEMRQGPTPLDGPPRAPFLVTRLKSEGKTAGFFVHDAAGRRYLFKLDLSSWPELLSGAEVVSSKLLHALGYYVPSYEILDAEPSQFSMQDGAEGHELVEALMRGRLRDGRVRVSASRFLDGDIVGPLSFEYYRSCRALRALRVAYAWLNNTDAKDHNTLIVRQGTQTRAYLIDFGTSLGANAHDGSKEFREGRLYDFEPGDWLLDMLTVGIYHYWLDRRGAPYSPALGYFPGEFDPRRWKPYAPNLAFEAMTEEDARWMAGRLAAFTRPQLEAAVAAGHYTHPDDAAHLVEVLAARRDAIVKAYRP